MDFFKDKIVFPEMLKLLLLSFAWLGNSGMCVLVGGGRAVNRKHHPAERCDLRFGFQSARKIFQSARKNLKSHSAAPRVISNFSSPQGDVCTRILCKMFNSTLLRSKALVCGNQTRRS